MMAHEMEALERNVRLYPWYASAFNAFFWMPVFFLYFNERFPLENVLRLEAIYYIAVVFFEVPSGYFSDSFGRRITLIVSSAALVTAYALFFFGIGFALFAAAQICLAAGISFSSGTDTSFHFDSLAALGREKEFADREAGIARNIFLAGAGAAIAGGFVAVFQLRLAYGLSFLAALTAFFIAICTAEPTTHERKNVLGFGFSGQIKECLRSLRTPSLGWLFGYAVIMTVLNHVPYEFYQAYLGLLTLDLNLWTKSTPVVTGLHMGVAMLFGAWFASQSIRFRDWLGNVPSLLVGTLVQTVIITLMAFLLNPILAVLLLFRTFPRALMIAPLNAAVAPQVPQAQRATYLSLQSLAGRLSFAGVLFMLSLVAGSDNPTDWPSLSLILRLCSGISLVGLLALAVTASIRRAT